MNMDNTNPPPVYLCQVSRRVSCGACCGLYNVADQSRGALEKRLLRRTERFAGIARTEDGIERFRRAIEGWTPEDRPFPRFHHCPFLGLIGTEGTRVGCLLHPGVTGNDGRDLRHMSYYGARACQTYFCPASHNLPRRYRRILRGLLDDWYAYGSIVTEHIYLEAIFSTLENRTGRPIGPGDFGRNQPAVHDLRRLVGLKLSWPYRRDQSSGICHFVFDNGLYKRPPIRWPGAQRPCHAYQVIFRELESQFESEGDMHGAARLLDDLIQGLVDCLHVQPARHANVSRNEHADPKCG